MKKERVNGKVIIQISILWIFVLAIIITIITSFFKNIIFATNVSEASEKEIKKAIEQEESSTKEVEPNENAVNILELMVENNYSNKKLVNEVRDIKYETRKEADGQLPKGEEKVTEKGKNGKKEVTALQQYENNTYQNEEIIEEIVKEEPVTKVIHVGTSEFLKKYKVHIGDEMYLTETTDLKKKAKKDSETITSINRYLNFEILEVSEKWTKVKYKSDEGYLPNDKLTSEAVNPLIVEKNRLAKLKDSLSTDMDLSKPSGLTLSDFKTVLSDNERDKNNIFEENYEAFYNAEQKYNVNGVFIAAIGIHESAWGNSYLAKVKKNLFGYKAYDRDPINSAQDFGSYEDCINTVAEALSKNYLSTTGSYYNGTTVEAVNTRYATDKNWHNGVYSYMEYLYGKLE